MKIVTWNENLINSDWSNTNISDQYNILSSPVVDSQQSDQIIFIFNSTFKSISNETLQVRFRASNNIFASSDINLNWSGFTFPTQITNETDFELENNGLFIKGRYFQIEILYKPTQDTITSIEVHLGFAKNNISLSNAAYRTGEIIGQLFNFNGIKKIDKASLYLSINNTSKTDYITARNNFASFQAINFQNSSNEWVYQPVGFGSWPTSGISIQNTFQDASYSDSNESVSLAPMLKYDLFLSETGQYYLWGYGYTDGNGIFWSWNNDTTNLQQTPLGSPESGWQGVPCWTLLGIINIPVGGLYSFRVYLAELQTVILDQWLLIKDYNLENFFTLLGDSALSTPFPISQSPFMTALRLRSLRNEEIDNLEDPYINSTNITAWKSSISMPDSGKYNYEIRNNSLSSGVEFQDGVSLEFWQIGGGANHFASWNYKFSNLTIGEHFHSQTFGTTYEF